MEVNKNIINNAYLVYFPFSLQLVKSFDCHGSGEEGANSSVESVAHCSK